MQADLRGEREIWITRGHLWALAVTMACIGVLSFFVGVLYGRTSGVRVEPGPAPAALISEEMEADELDLLLARVEAASASQVEEGVLTYPGTLPEETAAELPAVVEEEPIQVLVEPGRSEPEAPPPEASNGEVPSSGWAVQVASYTDAQEAEQQLADLVGRELAAYRVAAVVDGVTRYRVRVGGYKTREAAAEGRQELMAMLGLDDAIVVRAQ